MPKLNIVGTEEEKAARLRDIKRQEEGEKKQREQNAKNKEFVQFSREGMRHFVGLIGTDRAAAQVLVFLAERMSRMNEVAILLQDLADACGTSRATISRAMKTLKDGAWIRPRKAAGMNSYQLNASVFWSTYGHFKKTSSIFNGPIRTQTNKSASKPKRSKTPTKMKSTFIPLVAPAPRRSKESDD